MNHPTFDRISALTVSKEERQARTDLAALYRIVAVHGWDDGLATHISARVPGEEGAFLINPFGLLFEEITASSLVKVGFKGNILSDWPYSINQAGFTIHSAIHMGRPEVGCVIHLHTLDGMAVSSMAEGLLPLNQKAMVILHDVAYHDYEGVALDLGERERLQRDLGKKNCMILRNHGTLAVGETVGAAYKRMELIENSCTVQVRTLSMGRTIAETAPAARERTMGVGMEAANVERYKLGWEAVLRKLDRIDPSYRD